MICKKCKGKLKCLNTDPRKDGSIHRRYKCLSCGGLCSSTETLDGLGKASEKAVEKVSGKPSEEASRRLSPKPYNYELDVFDDEDDLYPDGSTEYDWEDESEEWEDNSDWDDEDLEDYEEDL